MNYLFDTNIISEIYKGPSCDRRVAKWFAGLRDDDELFVSVLVLGEVRRGVELVRPRDPIKAQTLERWLEQVEAEYADRTLAIDRSVAEEWGRISAKRPVPVVDALLAATAVVHDLTLVTRDERDVAGLGVKVLNPFRG